MIPSRLFKKEYAKELVKVAADDLEAAVILKNGNISRKENVLFHVQQCIEKALKACICHIEKPIPMVHDLTDLLRNIPQYQTIPYYDQIYDLTQFATLRRYEEGVAVINESELNAALDAAKAILVWSQKFIK